MFCTLPRCLGYWLLGAMATPYLPTTNWKTCSAAKHLSAVQRKRAQRARCATHNTPYARCVFAPECSGPRGAIQCSAPCALSPRGRFERPPTSQLPPLPYAERPSAGPRGARQCSAPCAPSLSVCFWLPPTCQWPPLPYAERPNWRGREPHRVL